MFDNLSGDELAVGQLDHVSAHAHDVPADTDRRLTNRPATRFVADIGHAQALATGRPLPAATASAVAAGNARLRSRAAATSPLNSGCGLVGLDSNSGCACVATKYGCTLRGSSTNSTRRPSGDNPEQRSPASSSLSRYALFT